MNPEIAAQRTAVSTGGPRTTKAGNRTTTNTKKAIEATRKTDGGRKLG